jgi:hypothetical protein
MVNVACQGKDAGVRIAKQDIRNNGDGYIYWGSFEK